MVGGRRFSALVLVVASLLGACGGDDGPEPERATVPTTESTTTTAATASSTTTTSEAAAPADFEALPADPALSPEQQVEAAYLHSWDIYLDALGSGRTEYLALVYVDPILERRTKEIEELVDAGHSVVGSPEDRSIQVTLLTPTDAVLIDEYTNHLTLIDASSNEPLEEDPNSQVGYSYTFVLEGGVWRVSYVERLY